MFKKVTLFIVFALLNLFIVNGLVSAESASSAASVIEPGSDSPYQLPDPGLLSDHPLYVFKKMRDYLLEATISDPVKKAELYLTLSDKRIAMAEPLIDQGKVASCNEAILQSEQVFFDIFAAMNDAKALGLKLPDDFSDRLRQSNAKHREMIQKILKKLPKDDLTQIEEALDLNLKIKEKLN